MTLLQLGQQAAAQLTQCQVPHLPRSCSSSLTLVLKLSWHQKTFAWSGTICLTGRPRVI